MKDKTSGKLLFGKQVNARINEQSPFWIFFKITTSPQKTGAKAHGFSLPLRKHWEPKVSCKPRLSV